MPEAAPPGPHLSTVGCIDSNMLRCVFVHPGSRSDQVDIPHESRRPAGGKGNLDLSETLEVMDGTTEPLRGSKKTQV